MSSILRRWRSGGRLTRGCMVLVAAIGLLLVCAVAVSVGQFAGIIPDYNATRTAEALSKQATATVVALTPSSTPTLTFTPSATLKPTLTLTPTLTFTATVTPTPTLTSPPSATPKPTLTLTLTLTLTPSETPSPFPTVACPGLNYTCEELTCLEAEACLAAGNTSLDANHDGIPCQSKCGY
jgi:hypothetical protein